MVRVIQKNLVYVIGIPLESATEENLRRQDMFGQYGHLSKIVINSRNPVGDKSNTCGVYLTYDTDEQALACIRAVDGFTYCRRQLKWCCSSLLTQSELRHDEILLRVHPRTEVQQPRLSVPASPGAQRGLFHQGGNDHAAARVLPAHAPGKRILLGRAPAGGDASGVSSSDMCIVVRRRSMPRRCRHCGCRRNCRRSRGRVGVSREFHVASQRVNSVSSLRAGEEEKRRREGE